MRADMFIGTTQTSIFYSAVNLIVPNRVRVCRGAQYDDVGDVGDVSDVSGSGLLARFGNRPYPV